MNHNHKTLNDRTLLGLRKRIPSPKPKEERIIETVNRIVSRIQYDRRNYKWENTLTRLAWECLKSSETQWPSYVRSIKSMNQTLWDVLLLSLFRLILTIRIMTTDLCSSDSEYSRTSLGHYIENQTPLDFLWCLLLWCIEDKKEDTLVSHRVHLYLHCIEWSFYYHRVYLEQMFHFIIPVIYCL